MNSRQRRKLEALQHNDKIRYEAWLKENAIYSRVAPIRLLPIGSLPVGEYHRARQAGMSRTSALMMAKLIMNGRYGA